MDQKRIDFLLKKYWGVFTYGQYNIYENSSKSILLYWSIISDVDVGDIAVEVVSFVPQIIMYITDE